MKTGEKMDLTTEEKEDFNNQFINLMNSDEIKYYYHVTERNMEVIFNEGLEMEEQKLYTTMIPIDEEIKNNPVEFVAGERNRGINITSGSIILIGILIGDVPYAVKKNSKSSSSWNKDSNPEFILDAGYIIGSIDIDSYEIKLNENYILAADIDYNSEISLY